MCWNLDCIFRYPAEVWAEDLKFLPVWSSGTGVSSLYVVLLVCMCSRLTVMKGSGRHRTENYSSSWCSWHDKFRCSCHDGD